MKNLTLRSSVALACALSLTACGGGSGNLLLGGSVSGLTKPGLQLRNNSGPVLDVAAGVPSFSFPQLLKNDEDFDVEIVTQPTGAKCTPLNNKGKTGAYNITTVAISCVTDQHALSGTIQGLNVSGLVLVNGADRVPVDAGAVKVSFAKVDDGAPYGVTVLTQPTGLTCTVQNGVGTMGTTDIGNILVTCG